MKTGDDRNALVQQDLETNHNFNLKDSKILVYIH